jgi:hypothetical protein
MNEKIALHRYWIWANALRTHFDKIIMNNTDLQHKKGIRWFADYEGVFLSHWYSALYVVVEGWKELRLTDKEINRLLESPNVERLRRFRNGVCHFQPDYLDKKFLGFMAEPTSVEWVRTLNREFGRYFLEILQEEGTDNPR